MSQRVFRFKQFAMTDQHCGMRIGTDGVLLGAWARTDSEVRRVADIGTGCGVVALMIAQRAAEAIIDAIEIDSGACDDAAFNFRNSPWSDRLNLHCCDFGNFNPLPGYDMIVSNPPFFTETLQSPDAARASARHAGSLSFGSLARCCAHILSERGRLSVILPSGDDDKTLMQASLAKIYPRRICHVLPRAEARPIRTLWEFSLTDGNCECSSLPLREDRGAYSRQYVALTKDYHLHL